jgi:hypothetical protein
MPPRGVKSAKRARQYEHIKESAKKSGRSSKRAKQIAAATVNKERRKSGEAKSTRKSSSRKSTSRKSTSRKSSSGARKSSRSTAAKKK